MYASNCLAWDGLRSCLILLSQTLMSAALVELGAELASGLSMSVGLNGWGVFVLFWFCLRGLWSSLGCLMGGWSEVGVLVGVFRFRGVSCVGGMSGGVSSWSSCGWSGCTVGRLLFLSLVILSSLAWSSWIFEL